MAITRGLVLLMLVSLLLAFHGFGCAPAATEAPATTIIEVTSYPEIELISLGLNPSREILNPGDEVVISVISEEWQAAELTWELFSDSEGLVSPGALSSLLGPIVIYTAPEESGEVIVSVRGRKGEILGTGSVVFFIETR